jgi:hypothetical protein
MEFLRRRFWDAATALDAAAREHDEGERFPLCRPDALVDLFRAGGLRDVRCEAIRIPREFTSFDDYGVLSWEEQVPPLPTLRRSMSTVAPRWPGGSRTPSKPEPAEQLFPHFRLLTLVKRAA